MVQPQNSLLSGNFGCIINCYDTSEAVFDEDFPRSWLGQSENISLT